MEREIAVAKLKELVGHDLHELAREYEITVVSSNGKVNKGWAGHVFERHLGIPINSAQSPNFGSWELKSIPLKRLANGALQFKETMAVTMIDPYQVIRTPFQDSHLLSKLKKAVCVSRTVGASYADPTFIHDVSIIDLKGALYEAVMRDYISVQECILDKSRGFNALSGKMGTYIQTRPKGAGHGSISRAFYARSIFLAKFIKL